MDCKTSELYELIDTRQIMVWDSRDVILPLDSLRQIADILASYTAQKASKATRMLADCAEEYDKKASKLLKEVRDAWNILCVAESNGWRDDAILKAFANFESISASLQSPVGLHVSDETEDVFEHPRLKQRLDALKRRR